MKLNSFTERRRSRLIVNCALLCVLGLSILYAGCASSSGTTRSSQESASEKAKKLAEERGPRRDPDLRPAPVNPWPPDRQEDVHTIDIRGADRRRRNDGVPAEEPAVLAKALERGTVEALNACLVISDAPAGAKVFVDGRLPLVSPGELCAGRDRHPNDTLLCRVAVAAGIRHVRIEAFGFEPFETLVECREGNTELVRWEAPVIPFEIRSFALSQDTWRPEFFRGATLPGFFFTVETSAPGRFSLEIRNEKDRVVARMEKTAQRREEQLHWDCRGLDGKPVPAGTYRARIVGADYGLALTILPMVIDSTPSAPPSGLSGFFHAPDAGCIDDHRFELGGTASAYSGSNGSAEVLMNSSLRTSLGAEGGGELVWTCRSVMGKTSSGSDLSTLGMSLAYKHLLISGSGEGFRTALYGRVSYDRWMDEAVKDWPPPTDPFSSWSSAGLGAVIEYRQELVRGSFALEYAMSDLYPELMLEEGDIVSRFYWWTYLRAALAAGIPLGNRHALDLSFSLALRSRQGSFVWPLAGPALVAAECRFLRTGSGFLPSLLLAGSFEDPNNWFVSGGVGVIFRL